MNTILEHKRWAALVLLLPIMFLLSHHVDAHQRNKAMVAVIFINNANTSYDGEIISKLQAWGDRKFQGVYDVLPNEQCQAKLKQRNIVGIDQLNKEILVNDFKESRVDYVVAIEVKPLKQNNHVAIFRYGKNVVAPGAIKIFDVQNERFLCDNTFSGKSSKDEQSVFLDERIIALFSVDSKTITSQAIDNLLYWIGETVTVKLPLAPQNIKTSSE